MVQIIKSRTRHGWNINGMNPGNWDLLKSEAKKNPPRWTLIMDNQDRAREWKDEIGGEVTYRAWSTNEDYYHQTNDAKATAQQMARHTEKVADCWQYWHMNEPGSGGTVAGWLELQDWLITYATEAKKLNRKVTTNGLAILKNWNHPDFVKAGHCDKLIRYWADNRDTFIMNVHTYVTGAAWSTVTPNYPANLLDRHATLTGKQYHINWQTYEPIMWYHREAWVTNVRAPQIIGEVMDFIIDEGKNDYHASVHQAHVTLPDGRNVKMEDELRALSDPVFDREMKGILGQRKWAEWIITGSRNTPVSDERYCDWLIENDQWWEDEYPDNCLAWMDFTMNPAWRYPTSGGGGFGHDATPLAPILLPKKRNIKPRTQTQPPVEPPKEIDMNPITVTGYRDSTQTANKVNIRKQPSTAATITGVLPAYPVTTTGYIADSEPVIANGYSWQFYELAIDGKAVSGYMATEFVKEVIEPAPDAKRYYDFEGATLYMTPDEKAQLDANLALLVAAFAAIEPRP